MNEAYYGESNVVAFHKRPEEIAKASHLAGSPDCYAYISEVGKGWVCSRCEAQYPKDEK